ncbi:MAG: DeoR/GlpR transcriptional regulator [Acidobacteria bacterium]|nr:DeoR/GlpR transcriptional regulator [Acidobacteriota bacterium]
MNERQKRIRERLARDGRLTVSRLAEQLRVAEMTIRRDLSTMERAGLLTRTHGGCVLQSPFVAEASFSDKQRRRQAEKAAIARGAVGKLRPGDAVYLDTGTTALAVARALPPDLGLKIFTNNLRVALELFGRAGVEVAVYGGVLGRKSPDLLDEIALYHVGQYRLDVAIVGADALDVERGEFNAADAASAALSRAAQKQADRVIVVIDSSKFGKRGLALAGRLAPGVTLITDAEADRKTRVALRHSGATILYEEIR